MTGRKHAISRCAYAASAHCSRPYAACTCQSRTATESSSCRPAIQDSLMWLRVCTACRLQGPAVLQMSGADVRAARKRQDREQGQDTGPVPATISRFLPLLPSQSRILSRPVLTASDATRSLLSSSYFLRQHCSSRMPFASHALPFPGVQSGISASKERFVPAGLNHQGHKAFQNTHVPTFLFFFIMHKAAPFGARPCFNRWMPPRRFPAQRP